jgi:hypothetical protein
VFSLACVKVCGKAIERVSDCKDQFEIPDSWSKFGCKARLYYENASHWARRVLYPDGAARYYPYTMLNYYIEGLKGVVMSAQQEEVLLHTDLQESSEE